MRQLFTTLPGALNYQTLPFPLRNDFLSKESMANFIFHSGLHLMPTIRHFFSPRNCRIYGYFPYSPRRSHSTSATFCSQLVDSMHERSHPRKENCCWLFRGNRIVNSCLFPLAAVGQFVFGERVGWIDECKQASLNAHEFISATYSLLQGSKQT